MAANFKHTLEVLAEDFEKQTGHTINIATGSTGALYNQIVHGAPYDLFFAADTERPERLEREGLIAPGSRFSYAVGVLTLWRPQQTPQLSMLRNWGKKVAIANPKTAPYGVAAEQVLSAMKLDKDYRRRLVKGNNIVQTYQYVESRNVEMGFVSLSQLRAAGVDHNYVEVPQRYYDPIVQQAVQLKTSQQPELAKQFAQFVQGNTHIIADAGYRTPGAIDVSGL
ncbi:molybdate ABC transporter substrate-binding protein [Paraferrimonas sedimenticola]|uniref:molybdate ABC transporter substrate-binding protein n=1 Tax=Paraferrimonas sedimenticola TaxID=375674 RepID=UPI0024E18DE7|nr:molybdate ABC transporter substrate-binding protein [Paraferrimonas sedimenticola]